MSSDMDIFNVQNVGAAATIATAVGSFIVFLVKRPWRKKNPTSVNTSNPAVNQTAGENSTLVNAIHSQVTLTNHYHAPVPAPTEVVDIPGKWNVLAAQQMAERLLNETDWGSLVPDLDKPYGHYFAGEYNLHYPDKDGIVLAYSTKTVGHEYHACAPYISFFEYHKKNAGWSLVNEDIGVFQGGGWGEPPEISIIPVSRAKFGVIQQDGSTNQGLSVGRKSLHVLMGDRFQKVLELIVFQSLDGKGWESTLHSIPRSDGFYDIEVIREGINGEEDLRLLDPVDAFYTTLCDTGDRIRPHDVFSFDGQKYNRDPAIR
ncbi:MULTISPECIES: hypothetical protein [Pseudomonas]|uniref:hypothetical protein n=1 Tax=Pseudomonas TaxID=286 RepID=UPI00234DC783|nr:hypothetical protein [Pseudomonas sp. BLCC-B112]MDC7817502.1 hypothetical protein [Pseudomonas sp. BLCC-B112]